MLRRVFSYLTNFAEYLYRIRSEYGFVGERSPAMAQMETKGTFGMYILVLIQGIAWISAIEIFRLKILTLAVAGADFFRGPSLNVASSVSSINIVAWSRTSSMNDMRLGRSLASTLAAWDGLVPADWGCSGGVLSRDSRAGWAGNSLMCSGSRRTRLPNGAIFGGQERSESWMSKYKTEANRSTNKTDGIRQ